MQNRELLNQFIDKCSNWQFDNKDYEDILNILKKINFEELENNDFPIRNLIVYNKNNKMEGGAKQDIVINNLNTILKTLKSDNKEDTQEYKLISKILYNSNNNFNEFVKIEYFNYQIKEVKKNFSKQISKKTERIDSHIEQTKIQYITMLGIFASIIVTFSGAFSYASSMFANIHRIDVYKIVLSGSFISILIVNILYFLFDFLITITNRTNENLKFQYKKIFPFYIVLALLNAIVFIYQILLKQL